MKAPPNDEMLQLRRVLIRQRTTLVHSPQLVRLNGVTYTLVVLAGMKSVAVVVTVSRFTL